MKSEPFADLGIGPGGSDYIGAVYELRIQERIYRLRSYDDTPGEISLMNFQDPKDDREQLFGEAVPYDDEIFCQAASWLLNRPGIERLKVFCVEAPSYPYVDVDTSSLT